MSRAGVAHFISCRLSRDVQMKCASQHYGLLALTCLQFSVCFDAGKRRIYTSFPAQRNFSSSIGSRNSFPGEESIMKEAESI